MSSTDHAFWDAVDRIVESGSPYRREAYRFVVQALGTAVAGLPEDRRDDPERRHLSGQELLEAVVTTAREEYGFLAATVFAEWGVAGGQDIGRIVFDLVEAGQLSARPEDTLDDFLTLPGWIAAIECPLEPQPPRAARGRPGV